MAEKKRTSQSTQNQSLAEGVDKELTCAICLSRYDQPKILPCLHSYCKGCLEDMSKKSREKKSITCPQCKVVHELPPQGIDGFTTFFTINNLLELLHIHENAAAKTPVESIRCSSGLDENPAVARCLTCSDYLCESCYAIHQKQKMSKDHDIKTLEEIKHSDKKTGVRSLHKRHHCNEHKDKLLELYCKTCRKAICFICALLTHKQHDCAVISEVRAETQAALEKQIMEVHTKEIEFQNHQKYTKNLLKISNEAAKSAEAKVNQVYSALIQSIEARCAQLIDDVHRIHESEVKQITLESESIAHSLSRFSGSIQFTKQLLDNGDDVEVMANSDQTAQTLTNLTQLEWDTDTLKPSLLHAEFDSMEECMSTFGKVVCTVQPDDVIFSNLPVEASVGKEHIFEVSLSKKISEKGYDASADITISLSDGSVLAPFVVKRNNFNSWSVSFIPDESGEHEVSVKIRGCSSSVSRTIDVINLVELDNFQGKSHKDVWTIASISIADFNSESRSPSLPRSVPADYSRSNSEESLPSLPRSVPQQMSIADSDSESRSASLPRSVPADYSRSNSEESLPSLPRLMPSIELLPRDDHELVLDYSFAAGIVPYRLPSRSDSDESYKSS